MSKFTSDELKKVKRIHMIGIGGAGMYPIAQILSREGFIISGSDNNESDTLASVREMDIKVFLGHDRSNVVGADIVVYSAAIMKDNPELIEAHEQGIKLVPRAEMLGLISERFENCVCVSGTHGKTTATSMITEILFTQGFDPSAFIGGKLKSIGGSGRVGSSDIFVVEACEFKDTFLSLKRDTAIILNVDADHLDYFGTIDGVIASFRKFASKAKTLIINGDDANTLKACEGLGKKVITFGLSKDCDISADNITPESGQRYGFDLYVGGEITTRVSLSVPGKHNIYNCLAAIAACLDLGATPQQCADGIIGFTGAGRRFEILGKVSGAVIADDYAHHPAELEATLTAAMEMRYNRVWAVFQPFTYTRTKLLFDDFVRVLHIPDRVVMSEIMGSREINTLNIYTKDLADKIDGSVWFSEFDEIVQYLYENITDGDLVITLGCGDIYKVAKKLIKLNGENNINA